jgi:uncharacterized protein (TIGR02246 family)
VESITDPGDVAVCFQEAWNAHDMSAFGRLFRPDATFVNRFATFWRGVDAIVEGHRGIHETIYRDSTLSNAVHSIDRIAEDVAVVHFWSRLTTGAAHPAGRYQVDTLLITVLTRRDGEWRIQAAENVTLVDPRTGEIVLREEQP